MPKKTKSTSASPATTRAAAEANDDELFRSPNQPDMSSDPAPASRPATAGTAAEPNPGTSGYSRMSVTLPQTFQPLPNDQGSAAAAAATATTGPGRPDREEQRAVGAFKVPPLDLERVDRFFSLAEHRFLALGIYHPDLRYSCVLEYLPANLIDLLATRETEIAASPDRYIALKETVLNYTRRPFWARMQLTDTLPAVSSSMSPTQLMCKLVAIKNPSDPFNELWRHQFLRRLPLPLFEKRKDKDWDDSDPMKFAVQTEASWSPNMAPVALPTALPSAAPGIITTPATSAAVAQVETETDPDRPVTTNDIVELLKPLVAAVQPKRGSGASRSRGRGNSGRYNGRGNFNNNNYGNFNSGNGNSNSNFSNRGRSASDSWCYYHQRYGNNATNCRPPCTYNQRTENVRCMHDMPSF